ncbi:MAG: T9SS type A sorting domain-containing protein [Bacteroidetes bacterium]|nr:T9SS type A sorting domain-containing protein [Bacteroidota bacterium]MDA0929981.1 T9SS type A sorting domain-containing protein [Bacteroidota bacterium]
MKSIHSPIWLAFIGCFSTSVAAYSQREMVAAGGDAQGGSGSVSWSIGQIAYVNITGQSGYSAEGVQQPAEFFLSGVNAEFLPQLNVFPNPSSGQIQIDGLQFEQGPIPFQIFNAAGQLISEGRIQSGLPEISVQHLPAGVYTLGFPSKSHLERLVFVKH